MTTQWVTRLLSLVFISLVSAVPVSAADDSPRPNIILMMADDLGWGDVAYNGHPFVKTPHLDRMAADGLRFDRWYAAAPVCSPTRGSCLTGRHPYRYGVYTANKGMLKPEEISLAEVLKEQGYATGHFGKWHLGTLTTDVKDANRGGPTGKKVYSPPWDNGFDVCFSTESKVPTYDPMKNPAKVSRAANLKLAEGEFYGTRYWTGPGEAVPHAQLLGDDSKLIMDRAVRFINEARQLQKPFFAVVWFHTPHLPVVADEEHRRLYPDHPFGLYGQHYHGCITTMDEQVGRLRASLDRQGVAGNTMVWFTSDNGPEHNVGKGAGSAGPFRGRKRSLYEGGVRVPGLLVWPDRIQQARAVEVPCVTSDYFVTTLDLLGIELPNRPYDGISLLPVIDGERQTREKPIGFQSVKQKSLVTQQFKIYSSDAGQSWELYDLLADPGEQTDLAAQQPTVLKRLVNVYQAWEASCGQSDAGEDYGR